MGYVRRQMGYVRRQMEYRYVKNLWVFCDSTCIVNVYLLRLLHLTDPVNMTRTQFPLNDKVNFTSCFLLTYSLFLSLRLAPLRIKASVTCFLFGKGEATEQCWNKDCNTAINTYSNATNICIGRFSTNIHQIFFFFFQLFWHRICINISTQRTLNEHMVARYRLSSYMRRLLICTTQCL